MNTTNAFFLQEGKAKFWKCSDYILKIGSFFDTDGEKTISQHPSLNLFSTKNADQNENNTKKIWFWPLPPNTHKSAL